MVADGHHSWIGTSNWGPGYFYESRNVGLMVEGEGLAELLQSVFAMLWRSDTTAPLTQDGEYPRPRIGR